MSYRKFNAIAIALTVLSVGQPIILRTLTVASVGSVLSATKATAKDSSEIATIAKAITVKVLGPASSGSGVIVKREGNIHTVLTAKHVVEGVKIGDEVEIQTFDGNFYSFKQNSIQLIKDIDLAIIVFTSSSKKYQPASIGEIKNVVSGNPIFVSGFPIATSSVDKSLWRFLKGDVIAISTSPIKDGYQLLYSNPTLPGMSGGSVLNSQGKLIGIHGRSEKDDEVSLRTGKAISTGTNQAIPIYFYSQFNDGNTQLTDPPQEKSTDDYLVEAYSLIGSSQYIKMLKLTNKILIEKPKSALAYTLSGYAKDKLGDKSGALYDYNKALGIQPSIEVALKFRANLNSDIRNSPYSDFGGEVMMDKAQKALTDYNKLITIDPRNWVYYQLRANIKHILEDHQGEKEDIEKALNLVKEYSLEGAYSKLCHRGDDSCGINDAIELKIQLNKRIGHINYELGNMKEACRHWISINEQEGLNWTMYEVDDSVPGHKGANYNLYFREPNKEIAQIHEDLQLGNTLDKLIYKRCLDYLD